MNQVVTFDDTVTSLGPAVVAIGVFDGVHAGHQKLLTAAVKAARREGVVSIALTFDRDPDQVVTPDDVAPQLLSLVDKCELLFQTGVDHVVVVPFTMELARLEPEGFLDRVVAKVCEPVAIHVGQDFRFGARAEGDVNTLFVWGVEHGADVVGHQLHRILGQPVTSTRIRQLIAEGDMAGAERLLTRPHRLRGVVVRGREQGRVLGFPTANVEAGPYAALPPDGVWAGRTATPDGTVWPSAISVGRPPMFPDAPWALEVHLIGASGDLYGVELVVEFIAYLRDQQRFDSIDELKAAIAADVEQVPEALGMASESHDIEDPDVYDPQTLAAAQAIADADESSRQIAVGDDWVPVLTHTRVSGVFESAVHGAFVITAPLEAAGIPYAWDPYPPEEMSSFRPAYGAIDRTFSLLVPRNRADEVRDIIAEMNTARPAAEPPLHGSIITSDTSRKAVIWVLLFAFLGFDVIVGIVVWASGLLS